jgi:methylglutamate dehydrogenase subunit C
MNAGLWRRAQFYRQGRESDLEAVKREVRAVRNGVGLVDISTLGKIDLQGRDCASSCSASTSTTSPRSPPDAAAMA